MNEFGRVEADKIQMLHVRIVKASVEHPVESDFTPLKGFGTDMSYKGGFNLTDKRVRAELEIKVKTDSEQSNEATGFFNLHFYYQVDNLDELSRMNNEVLEVSGDLQSTLASISYSTARGILLTRFQGTIFQDFYLPIIQPSRLLENLQDSTEA